MTFPCNIYIYKFIHIYVYMYIHTQLFLFILNAPVIIDGDFRFWRGKVPLNVSYGLQFTHYVQQGCGCSWFGCWGENRDLRCGRHLRCCSHLPHDAASRTRLFVSRASLFRGAATPLGPRSRWFSLRSGNCPRILGFISGAIRKAEPRD